MIADEDVIGFGEPATKTIGLCMIVKDEAAVIERCLDSVRPLIDYVFIEDTGSTDGTQGIIRAWLHRHRLPGQVIEEPWRDFAFNRSHAMAGLREIMSVDYALIMDADDRLVIDPEFDAAAFKAGFSADCYNVWIRLGSTRYHRPQICDNRLGFYFRGVVHEFLEGPSTGFSQGTAEGFYIAAGIEGARSNDPDKYRKDAQALERALAQETDAFMRTRYTFYMAQSWRDCGENAKSLAAYLDRAEMGGWAEEVFVSLYNAGKLQANLGAPIETVVATLQRAADVVPARVEALHAASRVCRLAGRNQLGYEIAKRGIDLPEPPSGLFIETWIYQYGLLDEFAINAYWAHHFQESLEAGERLLQDGRLPEHERDRVERNANFARDRLAVRAAAKATPDQPQTDARPRTPRVLIAILAKQKEAVLPFYLMCIEALDYPKDSIVLFVRTNNSTDRTREILAEWVRRVGPQYAHVEYDDSDIAEPVQQFGVHEWNTLRFRVLSRIRHDSMAAAQKNGCDFYFVVDVDNFIRPDTLRALVAANQPIVGPLLHCAGERSDYSNYHAKVDADGYFAECEEYRWLLHRRVRGLCQVDVIHCTYLVRADAIPRLNYDDGSGRHEYVIFSDSARRNDVPQYLDNREVYGYLTLEEDPVPAVRLLGPAVGLGLLQRRRAGHWQIMFCCGLHSSGSTWLFNLVREITIAAGWGYLSQFAAEEMDFIPNLFPGARLIVKTHAPPAGMRDFMAASREPITVTVRDPRDAVVSLMNRFGESFEGALDKIAGDAEQLVALAKVRPARVWRYEDGFTGAEATFDEVAGLLGANPPAAQRAKILAKLSPDQVKKTIETFAAGDWVPGTMELSTHWLVNHVGDRRVGKFAETLTPEQQGEVMRRTAEFCTQFGYDAPIERTFKSCPVCGAAETTKPRGDLEPHPYARCSHCGLYYQPYMRLKVYEAENEVRGDQMSESDRAANLSLARALYHNHLVPKCGTGPLLHLDVGSKYPYFGHCLQRVATESGGTLTSHGIDGIAEAREFGQALGVMMAVGDFEADPLSWDMPEAMRVRIVNGGFHCITLIHCLEHFYKPLETLRQIRSLMRSGGVLYIRSPDSAAPGIGCDFTPSHYAIHPTIWCEGAMREVLSRLGGLFEIDEHYELFHQRDYLLRAVDPKPARASRTGSARASRRRSAGAIEHAHAVREPEVDHGAPA